MGSLRLIDKIDEADKVEKLSAACWQQHVEKWKKSGVDAAEYCRWNQLRASNFYYWKRKAETAENDAQSVAFVAVEYRRNLDPEKGKRGGQAGLRSVELAKEKETGIVLEVGGCLVRVSSGFDDETLRRVVKALRGDLC